MRAFLIFWLRLYEKLLKIKSKRYFHGFAAYLAHGLRMKCFWIKLPIRACQVGWKMAKNNLSNAAPIYPGTNEASLRYEISPKMGLALALQKRDPLKVKFSQKPP